MTLLHTASGVLSADLKRIVRDRFLVGAAVYIVAISVAMRWILPWVTAEVQARWRVDLVPYHPVMVSYFCVVLSGVIVGLVGGFLLLETREEGVGRAMLVSPLPVRRYVLVVGTALGVLTAALTVVESWIVGLGVPRVGPLLGVALAGAFAGPIIALFLPSVASNKVEAFAQMKFVSTAGLLPLGAWFVPEPWQWLAAVYPPYWAAKAWWVAEAGGASWPAWVLGGVACSAVWLSILVRRFERVVRR